MFQDDIFEKWLDSESKSVLTKFQTNEPLTVEDKMILTLKAQTNHFYHLDQDIRKDISELDKKTMTAISELDKKTMTAISELKTDSDKRFEQVDKRFEQVDKRFEQVDKRLEQVDKRFEQLSGEIREIYKAINSQTWKMIGAIGLIVVLSKLVDDLPSIFF